jgi:hypothetical protein
MYKNYFFDRIYLTMLLAAAMPLTNKDVIFWCGLTNAFKQQISCKLR